QTNRGKGLDPNDPQIDQAFPPFAKFSASFSMKPINTLKREIPLRQIINYSNSIKNSYGLSYDITQNTKGTK